MKPLIHDESLILVDDDVDDALLLEEALNVSSLQVPFVHCKNEQELQQHLADKHMPVPGLILLDLKLPVRYGKSVLRKLKAHAQWRHVPVVIFTTSTSRRDIESCYQLGAQGFVTKPADFEDWVQCLEDIGNYWFRTVKRTPLSI